MADGAENLKQTGDREMTGNPGGGKNAPARRRPKATLKDVAKRAGVNFTLVSKYLTGNPQARMTAETRRRIEEALQALDYRPSAAARSLRNGHTRTLGLLTGNLTNAYFAHFADRALRLAHEAGYQLLIALCDSGDGGEAFQTLLARQVDGIICNYDPEKEILPDGLPPCPAVAAGRNFPGMSEVTPELAPAMELAAAELAGSGCRSAAGIFAPRSRWRECFRAACAKQGLACFPMEIPFEEAQRPEKLQAVCNRRPDAIVVSGWQQTILLQGLLDGLPGYAPRIITHANCTGPFLRDPRICGVIHSSSSELIRATVAALIGRIESGAAEPVRRTIPARFLPVRNPEFLRLATAQFELT